MFGVVAHVVPLKSTFPCTSTTPALDEFDGDTMPPENVDPERATALFLERFTPAGAGLLMRTTVLRKIADELRDGDPSRLPLALAEMGPIGFLAAPLAVLTNPDETAAASLDLSSHRARALPLCLTRLAGKPRGFGQDAVGL